VAFETVLTSPAVIAIDIGGTTLKGAVFDRLGSAVCRRRIGTFSVEGSALAGIQSLIRDLRNEAHAAGSEIEGIGLASPGVIDSSIGRVGYAANLNWEDLHLAAILEAEFSVPVHLEHDARAGAIAERAAHPNEESRYQDFIFVPIGTGISGAVVTGGSLVYGAKWSAGEFGHMPIVPSGAACSCGGYGCIEAYASATTVLNRYRLRGGKTAKSTPDLVSQLDKDPDAQAVWSELVEALALGISALSAVLDPDCIVIGGGLSLAGEALLSPLRLAVPEKLPWRPAPAVLQSSLGSDAGLIGAGLIARHRHAGESSAFTQAAASRLR
jgi:glucokinase